MANIRTSFRAGRGNRKSKRSQNLTQRTTQEFNVQSELRSVFSSQGSVYTAYKMDLHVLLAYSPIVTFMAIVWYQEALIYIVLCIPVTYANSLLNALSLSFFIAGIYTLRLAVMPHVRRPRLRQPRGHHALSQVRNAFPEGGQAYKL